MTRTTLLIPEELRQSAFAAARRRGISFGELVRESLRAALARMPQAGSVRDSFLDDKAVYQGPAPEDYSTRHDDYLYGEKP